MRIRAGQIFSLQDAGRTPLGRIQVEQVDGDSVLGRFEPAPGFSRYQPLFLEFEEAVNNMLFGKAGDLAEKIESLCLRLSPLEGSSAGTNSPEIYDVQIMNRHDLSLRMRMGYSVLTGEN